ncbi:uncharacterized protein LOC114944403 [Nylanderia fulva]|uniref:uncharacterized protein LOC114944403 n=1 Tax=Nylanderia fulva TaxID=613905 RepID=UPI0010FB99C3|nr:uncharacterized protein LOC114944403 [Nylanderia fulva]
MQTTIDASPIPTPTCVPLRTPTPTLIPPRISISRSVSPQTLFSTSRILATNAKKAKDRCLANSFNRSCSNSVNGVGRLRRFRQRDSDDGNQCLIGCLRHRDTSINRALLTDNGSNKETFLPRIFLVFGHYKWRRGWDLFKWVTKIHPTFANL